MRGSARGARPRAGGWSQSSGLAPGSLPWRSLPGMPAEPFVALSSHRPRKVQAQHAQSSFICVTEVLGREACVLISLPFDFPPFSLGFTKRRRRWSGVAVEAIDRPRAPLTRVVTRHPCARGWRDRAQDPLAAGVGRGCTRRRFLPRSLR